MSFKSGLPIKSIGGLPAVPDMLNMGVNDSLPLWPIGAKANDVFGNSYVYCKFGYTSAQGDAVAIDFTDITNTLGNFTVIKPTNSTISNFFGIAMNIVTSGNFGFVQVAGWNQVPLAVSTITTGFSLKLAGGSSSFTNDVIQGNLQSYLWGAFTTTSYTATSPSVGTVFIYGLGSILAL